MSESLGPQQALFVLEYLKDTNATQAALRAGYCKNNPKNADKVGPAMLKHEKIAAAIEEAMGERIERLELDADYVLKTLKEVVERCMQRSPVMVKRDRNMVQLVDEDGNHVWEFNSTGANTALGLLGRHFKLFTDKIEHSGTLTLEQIIAGSNEQKENK